MRFSNRDEAAALLAEQLVAYKGKSIAMTIMTRAMTRRSSLRVNAA